MITPSEHPDRRLVERARRGDKDAFSELVARYQRPLMARALRFTRHVEDADDLVQETFFRAWKNLGEMREDDRLGPWMFRVLQNLATDRGRRGGREEPGAEALGDEIADVQQGPLDQLLGAEIADAVGRALDELPEGRRKDVFRLRFVEDLTLPEIAERLGVHTGTIKVHLFRGVRDLRRRLVDMLETVSVRGVR